MSKVTWMSVVVAACVGFPAHALAQETKGADSASTAKQSAKQKKSDAKADAKATADAKKDAEAKRKKADDADKQADRAEQKARDADPSVAGGIAKGAADADNAADDTNADIVGSKAQNENEREALDPKLRKKNNDEGDKIARDIGQTTTTAANYITDGVSDATSAADKPGRYRPFALEWNPLGLIVGGRVSIAAEWAPVTHHVLIVSPHFVRTGADVSIGANEQVRQTFTGGGGEIGYRYYTGHRGMNGVFIGPSVIAGYYNASLPGEDQPFTNLGVAVDVGVQHVIGDHFVLGGGIGVEYLRVSHEFGDLSDGASAIAKQGVKPRLLFQGGYAF